MYLVSRIGTVSSGATTRAIRASVATYLFDGETVGIRQTGNDQLMLIIAYPISR